MATWRRPSIRTPARSTEPRKEQERYVVYCRRPDGRRQAHPPPAARHRGTVDQAVRHPLQRRLDAGQGSGRVPRPLRQARPQGRRRHHETAAAARRLRAYGGARRRMASRLRGRHLQGAASVDRRAARGAPQGGKQGRTPQGGQPESQADVWRLAGKQPSKRRAKR